MQIPELMFKPELDQRQDISIHQSAWNSMINSDVDLRATFSRNIVLAGGNTMFTGMATRLASELKELSGFRMRVLEGSDRKNAAFYGGQV